MKEVVKTFRMDKSFLERWKTALAATGSNESDLIRECVQEGFDDAVMKLIKRRKQAEDTLFKGVKRPFEDGVSLSGCALAHR